MSYGQYSANQGSGQAVSEVTSNGREKRVFTDAGQVAHRWAHQTQNEARYRDNFYFKGPALYSYGSHYLVGYIMPGNVALLNSSRYSVTTGNHKSVAWQATRHMTQHTLPALTDIRNSLEFITREGHPREVAKCRESYPYRRLVDYIANVGDCEGTRYLAGRIGMTTKQADAIFAKADRAKADRERKDAKAETARLIEQGKRIAAMSDSDFAKTFPRDGSTQGRAAWGAKEQAEFGKKLARVHKAAKSAGLTTRTTELWRKLKLFRDFAAGRDARIYAAHRASLAAEVRAWRNGGNLPTGSWRFPDAIKAALEKAGRAEVVAEGVSAFVAWQKGEGSRPYLNQLEPERPDLATIVSQDIADEKARNEAAYLAWRADRSQPRPASKAFGYEYSERGEWTCRDGVKRYTWSSDLTDADKADLDAVHPFRNANAELAEAEQADKAEAERIETERRQAELARKEAERIAKQAADVSAWLDGSGSRTASYQDSAGGALLRIVGDTLETSWGADVPLPHAVKAFRFVKLLRESGRTWAKNGKQVRVGHYQIDRIDSTGFDAGCHRINWPEIERVAKLAGVFDCPASDDAMKESA